jgi:cyclohexadienyl dehydratase
MAAAPGKLISQRLALMKDVAAYKWANGLAIEDLPREAVVLAAAKRSGLVYSLTVASVEALFVAQINAAKEIQRHWFEQWQQGVRAPTAPNLAGSLRPRLLELGDQILVAAARAVDTGDDLSVDLPGSVPIEGLSDTTHLALSSAFLGVEAYPDRLQQIIDSGLLRIGTTGDYGPFSWREDDGSFQGIDIAMAEDLAQALGVELLLVQTSWPTLMSDLRSGRYDIAMSGVSRTVERARQAFLSDAYYQGGKTAISRCDQAQRFTLLEDIDQPGVRVIVNPGGTNEKFVDANIRQAIKLLHPDNRTIFAELIAGRADVMFTDAIEVAVQTQSSSELCRATADLLSFQQKGYLLPQDPKLLEFVNLWLEQRLGDGRLAETFERYGVSLSQEPDNPD